VTAGVSGPQPVANAPSPPVGRPEAVALVAQGDSAHRAIQPTAALEFYERAIGLDSNYYEALYKAARELVDLGEFGPVPPISKAQYDTALIYGRRAVAVYPLGADGHFAIARVLGRAAQAAGGSKKIHYAKEVRAEALAALKGDSLHAGALHVMGLWNAEVMHLSGIERFFAQNLLGGGVLGTASWKSAQGYMEKSVAVDPNRIIHHLDLGMIYADIGKRAEARQQLELVLSMPVREYNDPHYKEEAQNKLAKL
jgi:tetratricopeptide (TPR) repeat protein